MLPHLPTLNGREGGSLAGASFVPVQVPPPPRFRPVCGTIREASLTTKSWVPPRADTAAKRAGMVYEEKMQLVLEDLLGPGYINSPSLLFRDDAGISRCIPDGVIMLPDRVCVIEIKLTHTPNSWWQLRKLYAPLCRHIFSLPATVLEICKNYEASVPFPEQPHLFYELKDFFSADLSKFGVLPWKM